MVLFSCDTYTFYGNNLPLYSLGMHNITHLARVQGQASEIEPTDDIFCNNRLFGGVN